VMTRLLREASRFVALSSYRHSFNECSSPIAHESIQLGSSAPRLTCGMALFETLPCAHIREGELSFRNRQLDANNGLVQQLLY
jgi:hypothetical protein